MYCPQCGAEIINSKHKFCHVCGASLNELIPESLTSEIESSKLSIIPEPSQNGIKTQKNGTNKYAKLCFGCGLASFLFADVVGIITFLRILFIMIFALVLNIIGISLGILSQRYKKLSEEQEPSHGLRKAGIILSIIGIVLNSLSLYVVIANVVYLLS